MRPRLALPLLVLLLAACGPAAPRRGATVLFASGADLQSINPLLTVHPLARQVQREVLLMTLVRYDSALAIAPYLARRWQWADGHRTLRLELADVYWHDGPPTTSADVRWTLETAADPAAGYPRQAELAALRSVETPDPKTVVLRFDRPQPDIPDVLTDLAILPFHHFRGITPAGLRTAPWNTAPVGNGPFRFVAHEPNRRWVFAANPSFPASLGGPPRLERLIVVVVDEPTTKLAALAAGELDFAGIQPAHASFVEKHERLAVLTYPLLFSYAIVFNTRRPPFDRAEVRRAVSIALDRRELVEGYLYGYGYPAAEPVPPALAGGSAAPPPADPDAARRLLGGRRVAFELLTVGSGEAALEQMIQARLAAVGFDVTIRQLELSSFLDRLYGPEHEFDAAVLGVPGDLGLNHLGPLLELAGARPGRTLAERRALFADSVPATFLYHASGVQGMNRRVQGVRMDVRGELATVRDWWVAQ